jgi:hypothetical protein
MGRDKRGVSAKLLQRALGVAAVEKVPAPKSGNGKHGHAVKRQHGFRTGNIPIAVVPAATADEPHSVRRQIDRRRLGKAFRATAAVGLD